MKYTGVFHGFAESVDGKLLNKRCCLGRHDPKRAAGLKALLAAWIDLDAQQRAAR